MARRSRAASPIPSATWRDGVHLTDTPIWCDARRRRDVCFVSSADRVARAGHGQLIATPLTLQLLGASTGGHLGVPLRRRFTLGTLRLELIPSGRGPGAAALYVEDAGRRLLYAGAVRPARGTLAFGIEPAEVRACGAVVVAVPYGPQHKFPPLADAIAQTLEWTRAQLAAERTPALLVDTALDGLEVATVLHGAGLAVSVARPIREAARRANVALGMPAPPRRGPRPPATLVWPAADRAGLARALGGRGGPIARVSGDTSGNDTDTAFAWANAADPGELLGWIESTTAREVFLTGAHATELARLLGPRARVLGPPQQMALFGGEDTG